MPPPSTQEPQTVDVLIDRRVAAAPDAVAVSDAERTWTYRELSDRADALARALPEPLGPGDRVGVHVGRRTELAAAVLAVLRSGAAYVPLDPDYPEDRLRHIARDADLAAVISDAPAAASALCARVIASDAAGTGHRPRPRVSPQDPAYVIYTSGTTGAPKGAVVPHRGVANILRHAAATFGFTPRDSVLALASIAFDFAVLEMLVPLTAGGRVHLPDRSVARDPDQLTEALERHDISFLMATPAMLSAMLGAGWHPRSGLTVLTGGETLPPALAAALTEHVPLWNLYGPTETSVYVTCERVDPADVTIGRPVTGAVLTVLDGGRPVAPGEPGELCVSGVGVGLGYLGRPDLTEERFRPLDSGPAGPCYRTGDRVRVRSDGRIEYLGRLDDQVKIRGFRLELAGIEAAIRDEPGVREAAVVLAESPAGPVLAAHVVFSDPGGDPRDLRARLGERLPAQEVPHHVLAATSLPRTPNGKLDRAALKRLTAPQAAAPETAAALPDGTAEQLLGVFREVLGRRDLAPGDNFFDSGGDSLSALRVVGRAKAGGLHLTVADLYAGPSVERLSRRVGAAPAASDRSGDPAAAVRPLPSQGWFFDLAVPEPAHFTEPIALIARSRLDHERLRDALEALVRRHPALASRFDAGLVRPDGTGFPLHHFAFGPDDARFPGTVDGLYTRIDPAAGPVCLAAVFRGANADTLLLVFHHLVVDGLSAQILVQDLDSLYGGRHAALGPAPISAFRHAAALTAFSRTPQAEQAEKEWLALPWREIGTLPATPCATPLVQTDMESFGVDLKAEESEQLLAVPRRSPASIEEVILAGVAEGAGALGDGPTVSVDVFRHGRWSHTPGHDVSTTVGWLAGVVPHVLTAPSGSSPLSRFTALRAQIRHLRGLEHTWGPLRHSHPDPATRARMAALPRPQLYLHYRGRDLTTLPPMEDFAPTTTYLGEPKTQLAPPFRPVEIRFAVADGLVTSQWRYSRRMFDPGTIERLAAGTICAILAFSDAANAGR